MKVKNLGLGTQFTLKFLSIEGENYYNCEREIVPIGTVLDFTFSNWETYNYIVADYICDEQANEGYVDDFGNRFTVYDGKYKVLVEWYDDGYEDSFYWSQKKLKLCT